MSTLVILGGILALVVIVAIIAKQMDKKRTAALMQLGMEMGFHYEHDGEPLDLGAKNVMPLFEHGHSKKINHILRGSAAGADVVLFDYSYTVGYGRSQQTYLQTVAAYRFDPNAPIFQLSPESFFHKLGEKLGYQAIHFDTNKDFSDRYLLRGPDENAIRAFFNPGMLGYYESLDRKNKWHVETGAGWIVFYVSMKRRKPEEMRAFLEETGTMHSAMKSHMSGSAFGRSA